MKYPTEKLLHTKMLLQAKCQQSLRFNIQDATNSDINSYSLICEHAKNVKCIYQ